MKSLLISVLIIIIVVVGAAGIFGTESFGNVKEWFASVFFTQSVTVSGLQQKYNNNQKIKILVIPGHEPNYGGAEFKDLKERDMNLVLARELVSRLQNDPHFDVVVSRDEQGWNPILDQYFTDHWNDIGVFTQNQKSEMARLVSAGKITRINNPPHGIAPTNIARRLFGINKWANETNIDIMIHVHFNDYAAHRSSRPGEYAGFTIYVPEAQYSNAAATRALAGSVFKRLNAVASVSTQPKESAGIVDDQDLIAIGQSNTADAASMLIEYGYIYEPQFSNPTTRKNMLNMYAQDTYLGLTDFFTNGSALSLK